MTSKHLSMNKFANFYYHDKLRPILYTSYEMFETQQ
jgi:hypothetical protein